MRFPAGLVVVALLAGFGCAERHEAPVADERTAISVRVERLEEQPWSDGLEVTAGVLPLVRATPGTVLMGRVDRVAVGEGGDA